MLAAYHMGKNTQTKDRFIGFNDRDVGYHVCAKLN